MEIRNRNDPYLLSRFLIAQEQVYEDVILELKSGKKRTHWIWFIFPQVNGLGKSYLSSYYAIKSEQEAHAYLDHPILGKRLIECANILLSLEGFSANQIFGFPDDLKVQSCMTLFAQISGDEVSVFHQVLKKYYDGKKDEKTIAFLINAK